MAEIVCFCVISTKTMSDQSLSDIKRLQLMMREMATLMMTEIQGRLSEDGLNIKIKEAINKEVMGPFLTNLSGQLANEMQREISDQVQAAKEDIQASASLEASKALEVALKASEVKTLEIFKKFDALFNEKINALSDKCDAINKATESRHHEAIERMNESMLSKLHASPAFGAIETELIVRQRINESEEKIEEILRRLTERVKAQDKRSDVLEHKLASDKGDLIEKVNALNEKVLKLEALFEHLESNSDIVKEAVAQAEKDLRVDFEASAYQYLAKLTDDKWHSLEEELRCCLRAAESKFDQQALLNAMYNPDHSTISGAFINEELKKHWEQIRVLQKQMKSSLECHLRGREALNSLSAATRRLAALTNETVENE